MCIRDRYYMLNKPAGVVSATTDRQDKTVVELIPAKKRRDLFPARRNQRIIVAHHQDLFL